MPMPRSTALPPGQPSPEELTLFTTLSAYADALDALPLDLTRSFSDLRELDAVLGAHLNSLTNRLIHLAALIEDPSFSPGERIVALKEVAEEARSYKMGGEDKIRVALNTAETIISHTTYIDGLLAGFASVPSLAPLLNPPVQSHIAGHLSDGTPLAPGSGPGGNNPANTSSFTEIVTPSSAKRKRPVGAGHGAAGTHSAPGAANGAVAVAEKSRALENTSAAVPAPAKKRKPPTQTAAVKARSAQGANAHSTATSAPSAYSGHAFEERDEQQDSNKKASVKRKTGKEEDDGGRRDEGAGTGRARGGRGARGTHVRGSGSDEEEDESEVDSTAGANRSARVSRAPRPLHGAGPDVEPNTPVPLTTIGEDADERRYCFCNNVSYGDMIGCDDDDCEREWFHLGCVGLLKPPQGTWYCDDCAQKRSARNPKPKKTKVAKTSGAHGGGVLETKARVVSSSKR